MLTCLKPNLPLPTTPSGSIDWDKPLPMCGKPATHYLDTYGLLKPESSTVWCAEHVKEDGGFRWTLLP